MSNSETGFSLIEFCLALALLALMLASGLPALSRSIERNQARVAIETIYRAVNLTRFTAINHGVLTTLCRSADGQSCSGNWQQGFIVFTDHNADRLVNGDDQLIRIFPAPAASGTLKFRAFQNKQYLQMTPQGFTRHQNGNFTYCPESGEAELAQQLIINHSGRTYFARDNDSDGLKEGANGKAISCE